MNDPNGGLAHWTPREPASATSRQPATAPLPEPATPSRPWLWGRAVRPSVRQLSLRIPPERSQEIPPEMSVLAGLVFLAPPVLLLALVLYFKIVP